MMYKNYIGKYIQQQRFNKGVSVREMSTKLGITPSKLNDIELGNCLPELEVLQNIEKVYGIDCCSCIEFLLFYTKKTVKKTQNNVKNVQVCYDKSKIVNERCDNTMFK